MAGTIDLRRSIPALAFARIIAGKIDFRRRVDIGMNQAPHEDREVSARFNRARPIGDFCRGDLEIAGSLLSRRADLCCRFLRLLFELRLPPDKHVCFGPEGAFKLQRPIPRALSLAVPEFAQNGPATPDTA